MVYPLIATGLLLVSDSSPLKPQVSPADGAQDRAMGTVAPVTGVVNVDVLIVNVLAVRIKMVEDRGRVQVTLFVGVCVGDFVIVGVFVTVVLIAVDVCTAFAVVELLARSVEDATAVVAALVDVADGEEGDVPQDPAPTKAKCAALYGGIRTLSP